MYAILLIHYRKHWVIADVSTVDIFITASITPVIVIILLIASHLSLT